MMHRTRVLAGVASVVAGCLGCMGADGPESGARPLQPRLIEAQETYYRAQYDSAAIEFEDIRAEAEAGDDVHTMAAAAMWLGFAANQRAEYDSARIYGERALALQLEHGLSDLLPRAYNALGLLAWEEYRLADAESLFVRSVENAEAVGMSYAAAVARGNLGLALQDLGDYDGAREGYSAQLNISLEYDSARSAAAAQANLAMLAIREGDPRTAVMELPRAISVFRELDDPVRLQIAMAQLGEAYADLGEPRLAFAAFDTAIVVARGMGDDVEVARNLASLAALHQQTGNLTRALDLYDEARAVHDSLGQVVEAAWNLRNSAAIYARLGNLERALDDASRAASIHADGGLRVEQVDDRILLAEIARLLEDAPAADEHLAQAAAVVAELGQPQIGLHLELARARFELEDGRDRPALDRLLAAEPRLTSASPDVLAEGYGLLARAFARAGDFETAASVGMRAVESLERIRSRFGSSELRATFLNDRVDVYGDLASALFRLGRTEQGFAVVDAARGRGVTAHLAAAQRRTAPIAAVAARDQMLARVATLSAQLDTVSEGSEDPRALASIRTELEGARRAYDDAYRDAREQLGVDAPLLGIGETSLVDIQQALMPGEALIEYLVSEDRLWVVVVTESGVAPVSTAIDTEVLAGRVRIARDLVASPQNDQEIIGPVMGELHEVLLGQARRSGLLAGTRLLTLVPHTVLNYLPFAALVDPTTSRYLIEDFDVRYLPSAAALPVLAARAPPEGTGRAALFAPKDAQLPQTLAEIDRIDEVLGRTRRYAGRRGTEARVRVALAAQGIVHLATHGVMNAQNPMFSRIELAPGRASDPEDDGRLEVHEVLDLDIRSALVFLSGCETGVGSAWATVLGRGEDHTTLERAFLYAGAANVVSTLWPIDDLGASVLAANFYLSRASSSNLATQLGVAQREMIENPDWKAPYYWAGYRLSGTSRLSG